MRRFVIVLFIAATVVVMVACGVEAENSGATSTSVVKRDQVAQLQSCEDEIRSVLRSYELRLDSALDKDVAAVLTDAWPSASDGDPTTGYSSPWRNLATLIDETKVELQRVQQRCAELFPQCPGIATDTVNAISSILDERLQRALNYKTDPASRSQPSEVVVPAVSCS